MSLSKPRTQKLLLSLCFAAAAGVVVLGGLSFWRKVQTFQPTGIEVTRQADSWVVSTVETPSTGLESGDVILVINGEVVIDPADLNDKLTRRSSSQVMVLRGEQLEEISYARPDIDVDFAYLVLSLIGVVYLLIGFYTVMRGINAQVLLFFFWCLASAALYLLTPVAPFDGLYRAIYTSDQFARQILPPLTLHFFLIFPRAASRQPWARRAIPLLYVPAAALFSLQIDWMVSGGRWFAGPPTDAKLRLLDQLELNLLVLYVVAALATLVAHLVRAHEWEERRQLLWITLGMAGGYVPFLLLYVTPRSLGLQGPELVNVAAVLPLALVPLSFAYAILRYRLWDIAIIVRDLATYTLTLLLGIFGFSLLNLVIDRGIPEELELTRNLMTFAAFLLMAGLMVPAKQGISSTLQRFHYRGTFRKRRSLSQFGKDLLLERDLESLCSGLLQELEEALDLEKANLYLVEESFMLPVREEAGPVDLPMDGLGQDLWEQEVESITGAGLPDVDRSASQAFYWLGYRYAFPLTVRGRRVGIVVAGYKEGQIPLTSDDVLLIRQLLNQAALAIENAQLLEQLQRQLNEVLELKQFNEEIIESSPAGIAVLDRDDQVVSANLAFAALAGVERSATRRRNLAELLPLDRLPAPEDGLVEQSIVDHQHKERHLQLSTATFLGSSSEALRVLVVHDITERMHMERALKEKDRLAALGAIAAGVAHEVNTPLTGISSYAQMLLADTPDSDPRHEILRKVERQTFRAARIVNSLLEFARSSDADLKPVRLDHVLDECTELLTERLTEYGIALEWRNRANGTLVKGSEGELHQVFTNLFNNAIEAMAETGGTVTLSVDTDDTWISTSIEDTGGGIPPEQLSQIFEPFYTTKLKSGGTGLGLSISYEIVRRHGGELDVESPANGGCRFVVRLPLGTESPEESQ